MTDYWPGQRIRLLTGTSPGLLPGLEGTVYLYDAEHPLLMVEFDNEYYGPLSLDGDTPFEVLPADDAARAWGQSLTAVFTAGKQAGVNAADRWAQHTFAGRSPDDAQLHARVVRAGLDDGEEAITELLPVIPDIGGTFDRDMIARVTGRPSAWTTLAPDQRDAVRNFYASGFHAGADDRTIAVCEAVIDNPDTSTFTESAGAGVAAPMWMRRNDDRYRLGFAAILHYRSGADIVIGCTRSVAEAITTEHRRHRTSGDTPTVMPQDPTIISESELLSRPAGLDRLEPDTETEYQLRMPASAWSFTPADTCDTIIGDVAERCRALAGPLPVPGLRTPHGRLSLVRLRPPVVEPDTPITAAVLWGGTTVGGLYGWGTPGLEVYLSKPDTFDQAKLNRYLDACRLAGQPAGRAQVMRALADEALLADAIDDMYEAGGTLMRFADSTGCTLLCRPVVPVPDGPGALQTLSNRLAGRASGGSWQIWTGRRWRTLPAPTTSH